MILENLGAERGALSAAIQHPKVYEKVESIFSAQTFTEEYNQAIWKLVKHIRKDDDEIKIDLPLLKNTVKELKLDNILGLKDGVDYMEFLVDTYIEPSTGLKLAETIYHLTLARFIHSKFKEADSRILQVTGAERLTEIRNIPENIIYEISDQLDKTDDRRVVHIGEGLEEYVEYVSNNPTTLVGISSGYPIYDNYIEGFLRKSLNIIGARTGVGKSLISDNIADHVSGKLKIKSLYLDTEMDIEGHWTRLLAIISGVPITEVRRGLFSENDFKTRQIQKAKDYLIRESKYNYINISGAPFEETLSIARRWVKKDVGIDENGRTNDCLIIYDYIKLMTGESITRDMSEHQILGFQTTTLHDFTVKHDLPMFATIQLNRDGISKEDLSSLSQSDRIGWFGDSVGIFKEKTDDELAMSGEEGNRKLIILKSRNGRKHGPNEYIHMKADLFTGKITEGKDSRTLKGSNNVKSAATVGSQRSDGGSNA